MAFFILLFLIVALALWPIMAEARRVPARAVRNKAPGEFAQLSQGVTHYQWIGPARGPVIVAVHGLTTPSPVWYAVAAGLARIGYRVVVYDLYGRGFSDAPKGDQDRRFFLTQLDDLLAHLGLEEDVTLLGYSMGGAIATAFAAEHPARVKRLMLIAPAGIVMRETRFDAFCRDVPVLGDWLARGVGVIRMRRNIRTEAKQVGQACQIEGLHDLMLAETDGRGYHPAVLSSRRHMLDEVQEDEHQLIGREGVPVVAIWGEKDMQIPLRGLGTLAQWNRLVSNEVVPGAGHGLVYTHGDQVADVLRSILAERAGTGR